MDWIDRFVPPHHRNRRDRRQGRFLVSSALGLAFLLSVTVAIRWWLLPIPPLVLALVLGSCLVLVGAVVLPWLGIALDHSCRLVVWDFFFLYTMALSLIGGLTAPGAVLAPVAPLLASLLLGRKETLRVYVAMLMVIAAYIVFPPASPWAVQPTEIREVATRGLLLAFCTSLVTLFALLHEYERLEALERLGRSQMLYAKLFDQTKDAVILSLPEGRLVDANQAAIELYDAPDRATLLQRDARDFYESPEDRDRLLEILNSEGFAQSYEARHTTLGGEARIVQGTTSTLRDAGERVEILMSILRDHTEARRLADEREETLRQLEHKNAELERFAATVSHDLKSPLLTVSGFLDLLRRDLSEGHRQRWPRDLDRIEGAVDAMGTLIDDLLAYARLGDRPPELQDVDLGPIVQQAAELVTGRMRAERARLDIAPDLPIVRGDPTLLRTVFQNLLDNAAKFSARGKDERGKGKHRAPRIRIGARILEDGSADCWVRDNGPGIPTEQIDRIFGLFHRLDRGIDGTGVGLASARRAVELMGGRLWAESGADRGVSKGEQGATFHLSLPLAERGRAAEGRGADRARRVSGRGRE